jgi:hypothetical protein
MLLSQQVGETSHLELKLQHFCRCLAVTGGLGYVAVNSSWLDRSMTLQYLAEGCRAR